MRLTCPHCSTEYDVPDDALAAGSRRLRCDRCGHEWRQEAPEVTSSPAIEPAPVRPDPEAFVAPEVPRSERVTTENLPKFLTKRDPRSDLAERSDAPGPMEPRRGIRVESRPVQKKRGLRGRVLLLLALIVIAAALFLYRSF